VVPEQLEGWYTDPFGRHEARWLSDGQPTKLVRDAGVESYDDPPDEAPTSIPTPLEGQHGDVDASDVRRADEAQTGEPYDSKKAFRELGDLFAQIPWSTR
jgi:hypothetical protein